VAADVFIQIKLSEEKETDLYLLNFASTSINYTCMNARTTRFSRFTMIHIGTYQRN